MQGAVHISCDHNGHAGEILPDIFFKLNKLRLFCKLIAHCFGGVGVDIVNINKHAVKIDRAFQKTFWSKSVVVVLQNTVELLPGHTFNVVNRVF